uniref:Uncharacterized protein n=1 Tax=Strombidinopsis acuminata TaxID=141414 RepID=A0A7S3X6N1_9SPIT
MERPRRRVSLEHALNTDLVGGNKCFKGWGAQEVALVDPAWLACVPPKRQLDWPNVGARLPKRRPAAVLTARFSTPLLAPLQLFTRALVIVHKDSARTAPTQFVAVGSELLLRACRARRDHLRRRYHRLHTAG